MLEQYAIIRAMQTVLTQPIRKFSLVQLARESKMAQSAAKYSVEYMLENGVIKKEVIGRTHQYQANLNNVLTRQWKILFSLEQIGVSKLVEHILKLKNVSSIVLYGSVAMGADDEKSDVDIIVIADTRKTSEAFHIPVINGKEVNIHVYTPMEWRKKASVNKVFYENVILNAISLYGEKPVVL